MNRFSLRCVACLLGIAAGLSAQTTTPADQDWTLFRKSYPYHIQTVALSDPHPGGARTLIVSEPPPHVTLDGLRALDPQAFAHPIVETTKVGYDGWVKDVVVTLPASGPREIQTLVDRLHIYLFATAYKSYALKIPSADEPPPVHRPLNLRVSAADLDRWLFRAGERFVSHNGGPAVPMRTLLASGASGVYYSEVPGVVALVAPKSPFSAVRRQWREFTLDSDLILGATSYRKRVAIFARERSVPVDLLPPLRTETILQLAKAAPTLAELSQSYERNNFFAGRIDEIGWDWAPVYLSDILIDSEYGSLLNLTDQLLKSWSSNGQVEYFRFPYPPPSRWPFPAPIILDAKVSEVTFNWNTKGAGYALDFPEGSGYRRIFSLNRTGALPVNYIPAQVDSAAGNPLAHYEITGYDYFAGLSDPNLARVVQYAALYQIFHEFGVADTTFAVAPQSHPEWEYLAGIGARLVDFIQSAGAGAMVSKLHLGSTADLDRLRWRLTLAGAERGNGVASAIGLHLANPRIDADLERALASGRRTTASLTPAEVRSLDAGRLARGIRESAIGEALSTLASSSDKIFRKYAESTNARPSGWIRTSSIVVSRTTGSMAKNYFGGHNLDPHIINYRVDASLREGEVRVTQEGASKVVLVSPSDVERLPGVLRKAALTGRAQDLPAAIERELPHVAPLPPRAQSVVLDLDPARFATERGLAAPSEHRLALLGGWSPAPKSVIAAENPAAGFSRLGTRAITVEKLPDFSFRVYLPGLDTPRTAMSYDAALDAVTDAMKNVDGPAGSWNLALRGFDRTEARNFVRTTEVQFTSRENLQLAGFAADRDVSSPAMLRALGERYDFRRAVIRQAEVEDAAMRFDIEIPAVEVSRPSLFMRIRIFFSSRVTGPVKLAVRSAVDRILARSTGAVRESTAPIAEKILLDIKRDLKNMRVPGAANLDFEIELKTDAGNLYVADNWSAERPAA